MPTPTSLATSANVAEAARNVRRELAHRIIGMEEVVEQVLWCVASGSHGLLVGVPGLAKTLLVSSIAELLDLRFRRIQFTPDLMPSDIVGTEILAHDDAAGRAFRFQPGPVFTNLLLADEINRTPPKTQAALMEAMEEAQVTSAGRRHPLEPPFLVLATQNPIEQEGTYPLPAAQLDRFLVKIQVGYPGREDEKAMVRRTTSKPRAPLPRVLSREEVLALAAAVRAAVPPEDVVRYTVAVARGTRPHRGGRPRRRAARPPPPARALLPRLGRGGGPRLRRRAGARRGPGPRRLAPAGAGRGGVLARADAGLGGPYSWTGIDRAFASGLFGRVMRRTPSLKRASTFSASTVSGRARAR
jgi:MoxR-like ATPase